MQRLLGRSMEQQHLLPVLLTRMLATVQTQFEVVGGCLWQRC